MTDQEYRELPLHYHEECDEHLYVVSGRGLFHLDGQEAKAGPGTFLRFGRRQVHGFPRIDEHPFVVLSIDVPRRRPDDPGLLGVRGERSRVLPDRRAHAQHLGELAVVAAESGPSQRRGGGDQRGVGGVDVADQRPQRFPPPVEPGEDGLEQPAQGTDPKQHPSGEHSLWAKRHDDQHGKHDGRDADGRAGRPPRGAPLMASAEAKRAEFETASSASNSRCASTTAVRGRTSANSAGHGRFRRSPPTTKSANSSASR